MATFVASILEKENNPLKFCINVSGLPPRDSLLKERMTLIQTPCLFVCGEKDEVIPLEKSKELIQYFQNHQVYIHSSGHIIPNNKDFVNILLLFLNKFK